MNKAKPISFKIAKIYLLGAVCLLIFYASVFNITIHFAENQNSANRLEVIAPYHFQLYESGFEGPKKIDPLVKIFDNHQQLPSLIKRRITSDWTGAERFIFGEQLEINILAQKIQTPSGSKIVYAIEDTDIFELGDMDFTIFSTALFLSGLFLFLIAASFIVQTARRIGAPFRALAHQLEDDPGTNFSEIKVPGVVSQELIQTLLAVNKYRQNISESISREKAFTRYVSHELRTPMTVIKGGLSMLRRQRQPEVLKQCHRIHKALNDMEALTHTFLLLARNDNGGDEHITVDATFVERFEKDLAGLIQVNKVDFSFQVDDRPTVMAHPVLLDALIKNLLVNAIKCTLDGQVSLRISPQEIRIADTGLGLNEKPRGYEGFGIGLQLVQDICTKYQWQFSLENRAEKGCLATIGLRPSNHQD